MSKFQFILIGIFVLFIIVGVTIFATYKGDNTNEQLPPISIWGTVSEDIFNKYIADLTTSLRLAVVINYTEVREDEFDSFFIESLARGEGPDAVLLPQDMLLRHEDKVLKIPYEALTERAFKDTYIRTADHYLTSSGILALPLSIDPIVMYWNRDIFTNAGIATYPKTWDELTALGSKLTRKDVNANIRSSALALGEFRNIKNAQDIFGTLMLQAGNPVIQRTKDGGDRERLVSALVSNTAGGQRTAELALEFFTRFVDPTHPDYSWNRGMANSESSFLSGVLATYFGYASEANTLRTKNPNIDYDIAPIPQARGSKNRATFGRMYGMSIVRSTQNPSIAFAVMQAITSANALDLWTKATYLPSVRRDVIARGTTDPYMEIFNDSALIADSWLDPGRFESNMIMQEMVESVTSGRSTIGTAVSNANDQLQSLIDTITRQD